jgi:hypothetical protein
MQARSRAPGWSDFLIPISQQGYGRVVGRICLVDGVDCVSLDAVSCRTGCRWHGGS